MWYKAQTDIGYGFGTEFQKQLEVETLVGQRRSRSIVSLKGSEAAHSPQTPYPMHPACIDSCFQTTQPSLWTGDRSTVNAVVVPASIDNLVINVMTTIPDTGISVGHSEYTGRGRRDEAKNYRSSCSVYDPQTRDLLLEVTGLHYHKLDIGVDVHAAHTLCRTLWMPDITYMSQDQILSLARAENSTIQEVIDLIAHKTPGLKVIEVNSGAEEISSLWFSGGDKLSRAAYTQYVLSSADAKAIVDAQSTFEGYRRTSFELQDLNKTSFEPVESGFDLAIVKMPSFKNFLSQVSRNTRAVLSKGCFALFVENDPIPDFNSESSDLVVVNDESSEDDVATILMSNGFSNIMDLSAEPGRRVYLSTAESEALSLARPLSVVHLRSGRRSSLGLNSVLRQNGWQVTEHSRPFENLDRKSIVVVVDELSSPLLTNVTDDQWLAIKDIVTQGYQVLWVTEGSQMKVSKPDNALVHGFFRTIRAEDRGSSLTTLDIEYGESPSAYSAIERVLKCLMKPTPKMGIESEFVERGGVIYINRILPDEPLNQVKEDGPFGGAPVIRSLHDVSTVAMIRAERLGTLEALCYSEMSAEEVPVEHGMIEVEIYAAGLNFKDVAVTMGIVPENEHLLGLEGAGIVRRVGKGADRFKIGDRVAVLRNGTFANRIQCPIERAHHIPDSLSFEDASTIPLVYLTSVYSLFDVGNLSKGQSVLIHSAAGGIGLSCIQLAKWVGADIYVTVGSSKKSKFLQEHYSIPHEKIFSSRDANFASAIMAATGGRGIDVIINSLIGELLDESWRICADGGVMVEIGKKDIVDRNYLSMEPFDRNCSFRAVDFSYKQITDSLIER